MLKTLNSRILLTVIGIVCFTVVTSMLIVQWQTASIVQTIQKTNAEDLLNTITNSVENEYLSIQFHRQTILDHLKEELKIVVDLAHGVLSDYSNNSSSGFYSQKQAQELARETIKKMRWTDDVGYFWINDTTTPTPKMIMHPTLPELDGTVLDDPVFDCALGRNENLFRAFNQVAQADGSGYVDYLWPKPTADGKLTNKQPKLSFVRLFEPWGWIVGSGIYIDDIETETKQRLDAVIEELRETFKKMHIGENSYMFMFTSDKQMLIHPELQGQDVSELLNPDTGRFIFEEVMLAEKTTGKTMEYSWGKPGENKSELFNKKLYVSYFEPLSWYICVSYYQDEINEPVRNLGWRMMFLSLFILFVALVLSFLLGRNLTAPLKKLSAAAEVINKKGIGAVEIPVSGSRETRELGQILSQTLTTIREKEHSLRENEKSLKASELKYRQLIENVNDAIFIAQDGTMAFSNNKTLELSGYSADELANMPFVNLVHPDDQAMVGGRYIQRLKGEKDIPETYTFRMLDKNNTELTLLLSTVLVEWNSKPAVLCCARDITEQNKLETAFFQAQKMDAIGQLAGGVAHDFNNMLGGILGAAQLLKTSERKLDDKGTKYVELIIQSVTRAADLTSKLLAFGRKGKVMSTAINIHSIIDDTLNILSRTIDKKIKFSVAKAAADHTVIGDNSALQNALMNLGINASHSMAYGGDLQIKTKNIHLDRPFCDASSFDIEPGEYIAIEIRDTGSGIPREDLQKIFEPFFTTKKQDEGTGLGLAAVYGTVQDHHGAIDVYSEVDIGTTFHIYLPCSDLTVSTGQISEKIIKGRGTILLIDDEEIIRITGKHLLEKMGYDVLTAQNGKEGLKIFQNQHNTIALTIIDMIMPEMNGREAFIKMKAIDRDSKIIISSGFTKDESLGELREMGLAGFIRKPFSDYELSKLLADLLKRDHDN